MGRTKRMFGRLLVTVLATAGVFVATAAPVLAGVGTSPSWH